MVHVALDAVRSGAPDPDVVRGAVRAVADDPDLEVTLVGPAAALAATLDGLGDAVALERTHVLDAARSVGDDDDPVVAVRARRDASVRVALALLAGGEVDAAVSAGPVLATTTAARFSIGRVRGLRHPALAVQVHPQGRPLLVLDAGAEPDATAGALVRYGELGAAMARARGVAAPRVAALEPFGTSSRAVGELLTLFDLADLAGGEFVGATPARHALDGHVDVLVTGGAAGRILVDAVAATSGAADVHGVLVGTLAPVATLGPASPDEVTAALTDLAHLATVHAEVIP